MHSDVPRLFFFPSTSIPRLSATQRFDLLAILAFANQKTKSTTKKSICYASVLALLSKNRDRYG